ncbi:peptide/nickel transport system ATP-binding protein [Blastococcus aggregatus]|uniref:Peptide/nickel transport system ATP-binding protein n=1 Tax=Blastococcus aggregatus TaxID=38502 RepID=A0A285V9R9_9ACTN|nr:ABC transporter ATP-binding protein [Blastococcus aggregatus]SOC49786.1 peptide/nickel transport system ATP-binding protein [Blastococcus aggregatus]
MTASQKEGRANEPLLEVDDLRTYFDTPRGIVKAVDGVSLRVDRGKTLGIVGESGSGKTVLSRSIMNLLPKANTIREGSVRFEGRELTTMKNKEMRTIWGAEMAMVLQDPMTSLNPVTKIGEQITESLGIHLNEKGKVAKAHAVELLKSVGIPAAERRLGEYPHQLSGGMRQRVTIAIALACSPKLLVADEPTTALDVTVQRQILDLLESQQTQRNMGLIIITHDLGVVAGRADEIAVMYAGRVVERAPTRELFARNRHPYTEGLLRSIPRLHQPSHSRLQAIPGRPPDLVDPPAGCPFAPRCNYAQDKCLTETPVLAPHAAGHEAACHFPVGTTAGQEALARNVAAGRTAAGTPLDSTVLATAGAA